MVIKATYCAV